MSKKTLWQRVVRLFNSGPRLPGHGQKKDVVLIDDACFGTEPAYPSLDQIRQLAQSLHPELNFDVADGAIRISPN